MARWRSWLVIGWLGLVGGGARAGGVADAERLLAAGRVAEAERLLAGRLAGADGSPLGAEPLDVAAAELWVDVLVNTGRAEAARAACAARAERDPDEADAWYLLGRAETDPAKAEAAYREALARDGGHARAWMGLGSVLQARGDAAAADAYRRAIAGDPGLEEAWRGLVIALDDAGRREAAVRAAREGVAANPDAAPLWLAWAALDKPGRIGILEQATARLPGEAVLWVELARNRFEASDWPGALAAYDRALALDGDDADLRLERAVTAEVAGGALRPEDAATLLSLRSARDLSSRRAELDGLVARNPASARARMVRGNVLAAAAGVLPAGDPGRAELLDRAEADLRGAVDLNPADPDGLGALGSFLVARRRAAEAVPLLDRAVELRPDDVSLAVLAALALGEAGQPAEAEARLLAAAKRFPDSVGPPVALARLRLGTGRRDEAVDGLLAALVARPDPELAVALASAARQAGREADAAAALRDAAKRTGDARLAKVAEALAP